MTEEHIEVISSKEELVENTKTASFGSDDNFITKDEYIKILLKLVDDLQEEIKDSRRISDTHMEQRVAKSKYINDLREHKAVEEVGLRAWNYRQALEALWETTHYISNQAMQYAETATNLQCQADNCDNYLSVYWECDTLDDFIKAIAEEAD